MILLVGSVAVNSSVHALLNAIFRQSSRATVSQVVGTGTLFSIVLSPQRLSTGVAGASVDLGITSQNFH